jgi:hypothetical protein
MDDGLTPGPEEVDRQGAHRGTGLREQIRRELGVMFSRRTQPIPVRVAKWAVFGLRAAEEAEHRGESGNGHRARGVINAAMLKDREQGRAIDAHRTLDRAITRLEERD